MDRWIMLQLLGYIVQICHEQRAENKQKRQEKREENNLANRSENEGIKTEYLYPIIPGAHFKKGGIFLALKGLHIPAQGNALGKQ